MSRNPLGNRKIKRAHWIIHQIAPQFLLEPEENYNTFRFLEGFQFYNDPTIIKSAFVAKNYDLYESQLEYTLTAGFPLQTYLGSYSDNPKKEMENNIHTRLCSVNAYSITPDALDLAIASCMPDFKFSNYPLRSVKNIMKRFTPKLDHDLQEIWVKTITPKYNQRIYDHIQMF